MNNMKDLHCPTRPSGVHPVKPIHNGPHFLQRYNFLSEFETALEKKLARENLGITWETFGSDLLNTEGFLELVRKIIEELLAEMSSVNWGNIKGDIRNQEDLILYIADAAFRIIKVDSIQDLDLDLEEGTIAYVRNLKTLVIFNGTTWEQLKSGNEEIDLGDIPERLDTVENDVSDLKNRVATVEGKVTDLENTDEDLQNQIDGINTRVDTVEIRVTDVELRTTTIEALIEAINRAIAALLGAGESIYIDTELLEDSKNPVENLAIYKAIQNVKTEITLEFPSDFTYLPSDAIPDDKISTHGGLNSSKAELKGKSFSELMDLILFPAQLPTITDPTGDSVYKPSDLIDDAALALHGGLSATKLALKGLTFSALMDKILFPVTNPTIVAPYVDFSLFGIPNKVEANTVVIPTTDYIREHTSFNKGSMTAGRFTLDRAGEGTYSNSSVIGSVSGDVYIKTSISVTCTYNYEAGPTPLNSNGLETTKNALGLTILALPAGTISGRYQIIAYLPVFANNLNNQLFTKIKVWEFNDPNEFELSFASENPEHHSIKIPSNKDCLVWYWDTVVNGGSWQKITFDFLDYETIDVGDKAVDYKIMSRHHEPNRLDFVGATKYKIKIS